jgi:hypothetical protein
MANVAAHIAHGWAPFARGAGLTPRVAPAIAQSVNGNSVMRTPRATPKETSRAIIAAWVHAIHDRRLCPDDRTTAGLEASPTGARHPGDPGVAGAPVDYQHRGLHSAGAEPVQGLLAGLGGGADHVGRFLL